MKKLLKQPVLFPFCFPIFFVLRVYRRYYGFVEVSGACKLLAIYLLGTALFFLLLRKLLRDAGLAAIAVLLLQCFFFFWAPFQEKTIKLLSMDKIAALPLTIAAIFMVCISVYSFSAINEKLKKKSFLFLNILFLLYIGVEGGVIIEKSFARSEKDEYNSLQSATIKNKATPKPDVYCIILDEYAGTNALRQNLDYDHSDVDSFLKKQGFSVQEHSRSNYNLTLFSVSSMLNATYFNIPTKDHSVGVKDLHRCFSRINENRVTEVFRNAGYAIRNYSMFDMKDQKAPDYSDVYFFPVKNKLITETTFYDMVLARYRFSFKGSPHIQPSNSFYNPVYYNDSLEAALTKDAAKMNTGPSFYYVHFYTPHAPFFFDKNGRLLSPEASATIAPEKEPEHYLYNLNYATRKLENVVNALMAHKKDNAIILVMGDHGYRHYGQSHDPLMQVANLNAVYFPDQDYQTIYDSVSNVNMMRLVMNKALGTSYALLPDSFTLLKQKVQAAVVE